MAVRSIFVHPRYPENLEKLFDLAYNLWTLWDRDGLSLFHRVDTELFTECSGNPVQLLLTLPEERMAELSRDKAFVAELERVWQRMREATTTPDTPRIGYFSMEFGLYKLPIYAGGLGMLAGDHMKGASDRGLPIIGVGLYYRYGYFIQRFNVDHYQEEIYREAEIYSLPMKEWKTAAEEPVFVSLDIGDTPIRLKVWRVEVGRVQLLLLDANVPENPPEIRSITDHLYVGDRDKRLLQEIILGVGGLRALDAVGIKPDVYHLNEGHSAFLIVERLATLMKEEKLSYAEAGALIKHTTVFTTHTPVEAGNESFPVAMIRKYLEQSIESLGVSFEEFAKLGSLRDDDNFWLPALAIRFSRFVNGVSQIHAGVSRHMWQGLFPARQVHEVPIVGITNGVHGAWMAPEIKDLLRSYLGTDLLEPGLDPEMLDRVMEIPDREVWDAHIRGKRRMISFLRRLVAGTRTARGYSPTEIKRAQEMLNAGFLTIGFARRFATYKRANLILRDKERLARLLKNPDRPVQLIFGGKAHPADTMGKEMIREVLEFADQFDLTDRIFFVENYDRIVAEHMVQGCDVWLNNPIKPSEASGTSGMKAGMNGILNLSVLDGWWPECYDGDNGWAITAGDSYDNPEMRDAAEANQIYDYLEDEISSLYFTRDDTDIPRGWVQRMKASIFTVAQGFCIGRMLDDYNRFCYEPALEAAETLAGTGREALKTTVARAAVLKERWANLEIRSVRSDLEKNETLIADDRITFECEVFAGGVDPEELEVQIYYHRNRNGDFEIIPLDRVGKTDEGLARFSGQVQLQPSGPQELDVRLAPADSAIRELYPELLKWAP